MSTVDGRRPQGTNGALFDTTVERTPYGTRTGADLAGSAAVSRGESTAAQLRRRHVAALRLPTLACGHRDPLSCLVDESDWPSLATYCCATMGLAEAAALARMGLSCSEATCARLLASVS